MGDVKSFFRLFTVLAVLLALAAGGYYALEDFSASKVREFSSRYDNLVRFDFERALINPFDQSLYVWGLRCDFAVGARFTAGMAVVEKFDREHPIPRYLKGRVENISIPVDFMNFGTYASELRKMGYEELNFDLETDYIYEDRTRRLSVRKLCLDGPDSLRVSAGFDLGDMKLHRPGLSGLIGVSVLDAGLVLQDRSITRRLLDFTAAEDHIGVEELRRNLLDSLQLRMQESRSLGNGYAENFYAGLLKFIEKPGQLVLRASPGEPVPLLYMFMGRDFEELLNLYGVTVEADGY
ncbi:hypothetical protein [Maridesulfovibrio sp. FT414]|uniref:hypothetical protein n=1 Tax=Maridesulfovibrio sp. FT414 TaxID=2979469 RepID=UPI003D800E3D